jgi:predicted HTH domain antitoxin
MMKTTNIPITVPDDILLSLRTSKEEFATQILRMSAMMFYKSQKLSASQAANLAEMSEYEFIQYLGRNGVSIFGDIEDIKEDYVNT